MPQKKQTRPETRFSLASLILLVIGGCFILFGAVFSYFLGIQTRLDCSRSAAGLNCALISTWMELYPINCVEVPGLQRAWIDSHCDEEGCMYWVTLTTDSGDLPLSDSRTSDHDSQLALANQINASAENLELRKFSASGQSGFWVILPLVFLLTGLFIVFGLPRLFKRFIQG